MSANEPPTRISSAQPERGALSDGEIWWGDHQSWLQKRGYLLRLRYTPGWVSSSWKSTKKPWFQCEDAFGPARSTLLDATRTSDGAMVVL
ncbi:hypothetical protein CERSUDRAFT_156109 [Gelatoporia subvermispora B]|uniref:Uncharacterized protein n=1 Tax=Ceriporiopsis subvermispora (strain B) TaxID=914234 RepID=M2RDE5_CERS8|nr:hypothetical protein CERSUDRAFT_156109 [Gelatoporia subvermispora B]